MRVRDIMNTDVATAEPGTPISDVAKRIAAADVGAVVIVEGGKPVGIVTDRDLVVDHLAKGHTQDHAVQEAVSGGGAFAGLTTVAPDLDVLEAAQEMGGTRWAACRWWRAAGWWGSSPPATWPSSCGRPWTACWPRARRPSSSARPERGGGVGAPPGGGTAMTTEERARPGRGGGRTLRDALQGHAAGPEVAAALGPLADRAPPAGWGRWTPAQQERYLDAALDEARAAAVTPAVRSAGSRPAA